MVAYVRMVCTLRTAYAAHLRLLLVMVKVVRDPCALPFSGVITPFSGTGIVTWKADFDPTEQRRQRRWRQLSIFGKVDGNSQHVPACP